MDKLIILGAGQHAKVIVSIVREFYGRKLEIAGYLDDNIASGTKVLGFPVLGKLSDLSKSKNNRIANAAAIGISNRYMKLREKLFLSLKTSGFRTPNLIHGKAFVSRFAILGEGIVLNPLVSINAFAKLGNNIVVYSNATIEHETILEDNVYIGPGVNFSSNARVSRNTFIGAGAKIIPDIKIGSNVIVGAGSVVIKDIPNGVTAAGVPVKIISKSSRSRI